MEIDPSREVRKLAIQNVAMGDSTVESVTKRLSDKEESVRLAACSRFMQVLFSEIPVKVRRKLLVMSIKDRSEAVR